MTGPGGDEVARVSVRVVPNTDDFKRELERQLREMRDSEITIPVKFDIDRAELNRQLHELETESIKIPVTFDVENVRDDIKRATRGAKADKVTVPMELDADDLEAQIARITQELRDLDGLEVSPEAILKATDLRAELQRLKAELAELSAREYDIRVGEDGITEVRASVFDLKATLAELQRDPVQIKFDAQEAELLRNIAEVEAALNKLDGKTVTPEISADIAEALAKLAAYQAALNELDGKRIEATAELDADTLRADARIQAFLARMRVRRDIKLPVDVEIREDTLAGQLNRLGKRFPGLGDLGRNFAAVFDDIGGVIGGITNNLGTITRGLITAGAAAVQLATMLAVAGTVAIGLAAAGATVTAAWGAASTAISTLPGVLALIAVPAAAVMLGLDGIKKAAASIAPEFDKLKASVSSTFESGLTPVFKRLAGLFPILTNEINDVARATIEVATDIEQLITSTAGVAGLETLFSRVAQAIRDMRPGIIDIVTALGLLGSQKAVFDVFTTAVNTFGDAFRRNVIETINDGSLTAAFQGLEGTLAAVARGFADLVKNGIQLFAAAAPGVNSFLNDLTGFFNRFDWNALGTTVGGVFRGLGETLRQVPQGVITDIQVSFQKLADTFQSPAFQAGLGELIALLPRAIDLIRILADGFARTALAISGSADVIVGGFKSIALAMQALNDPTLIFSDKFKADLDAANAQVGAGLAKIEQSYATFDPQLPPSTVGDQLGGQLDTVVQTVENKMTQLRVAAERGMSAVQQAMVGGWAGTGSATVAAATSALTPVAATASVQGVGVFEAWDREMDKIDPATRSKMTVVGQSVGGELAKVPPAAGAALAPLPGEVSGVLDQVPAAAEGALSPLQELQALQGMKTSFGVAFMGLVGTTQLGMEAIAATVASGVPGIVAAFNFQNVGLQLGLAFQGLVGTATLGMASLAATVASGMPAIQAAFNFTNVGLQVGQVFLGLVGSFTLGMASLAATVTAGMPAIAAAFNFTTISQGVGLAFLGLIGTVNLGMLSVAAAVTTGMTQVQAAFSAGLLNLTTTMQTTFGVQLAAAMSTSLASVIPAVNTGMLGIIDAIRRGGTLMIATMSVAIGLMATDVGPRMQVVANAVDAGMQSVTEAVTSNMDLAQQALSAGVDTLGVVVQAGLSGLAAAATAGMANVTAAINAGMAQAVAAVTAAGAQISSAGQVSMAGFGAAIQVGMNTAVATVVAGAARITTSVVQMGQMIISTITASMGQFQTAVVSGMNAATAAVTSGVARMVGALRAGAGQFQAIGVQMMQGLRAGILSQAGSIAAAAAQVVSQAVAAARAAAQVRSPSRVFMQIGTYMGEGLALGMEKSGPRVERAADTMISSVAGIADQMTSTFSDAQWAADFGAKVENSLGDTTIGLSNADVVGAIRRQSGDLDQSATLGSILVVLQAMYAQSKQGSGVALGAQGSRARAELGAF